MKHIITISIDDNGIVKGDLDNDFRFYPKGTESIAESTTIDGQAHSVLNQALEFILIGDLERALGR